MPSLADLYINLEVLDATTVANLGYESRRRWLPGTTAGKREDVILAAGAFTALSPPTGSRAVIIVLGTAVGLTLKGLTGDTGIALVPSSNPLQIDAILPLGTTPSIGITSAAGVNQTISLIWL